jgi:hypothetical protein
MKQLNNTLSASSGVSNSTSFGGFAKVLICLLFTALWADQEWTRYVPRLWPVALALPAICCALLLLASGVLGQNTNSGLARLAALVLSLTTLTGGVITIGPTIRPWFTAAAAKLPEAQAIKEALNLEGVPKPAISTIKIPDLLVKLEEEKPLNVQDLYADGSPKAADGNPKWLSDATSIEAAVAANFAYLDASARQKATKDLSTLRREATEWSELFSSKSSKSGASTPNSLKALLSMERGYTADSAMPDNLLKALSIRVAELLAFERQLNAQPPVPLSDLEARVKAFSERAAAMSSGTRTVETRMEARREEVGVLVDLISTYNPLVDRLKNGRVSLRRDSGTTSDADLWSASSAFYEPLAKEDFVGALAAICKLSDRVGPEPKQNAEGVQALEARLAKLSDIGERKAFAQAADTLLTDARLELELLERSIDQATEALPKERLEGLKEKVKSRKTSIQTALKGAPSLQSVVTFNGDLDFDDASAQRSRKSSIEMIGVFLARVKYYEDFLGELKAAQKSDPQK